MRLLRLLLAALVPAVLTLASPAAEACSPLFSDRFYTFQESLPGDGATGVPLDGAILLGAHSWSVPNSYTQSSDALDQFLTVTVTDTVTGQAIPGSLRAWWGAPSGMAWTPQRPLEPGRRYELVGTLRQSVPRPTSAQGPTQLRVGFTTGTQAAPPLELLGGLSADLELFERDQCESGPCGGCNVIGRVISTRARLLLPGVRGGASLGSYRYEVRMTSHRPDRFDGAPPTGPDDPGVYPVRVDARVNTPGAAVENAFELPPSLEPYPPCFIWRAVDPQGRTVEGPPVCLSERVAAPATKVPEAIHWERGDPAPANSDFFGGCATGPGGAAPLALLGLWAMLGRSRARRG